MRISDWSSDVCSSDLAHIDRLSERRRWNYAVPDEAMENLTARPAPQHGLLELHDLAEALERLPEEQRQTALLAVYEGLAYRDVAEARDAPTGPAISRLSRDRPALPPMLQAAPTAHPHGTTADMENRLHD